MTNLPFLFDVYNLVWPSLVSLYSNLHISLEHCREKHDCGFRQAPLHIEEKSQTKKGFRSFQAHIRARNRTLFVSYLFLIIKQTHISLSFDIGHASQFP
jgi:hypothetical protein